ncbi:MAG TPA: tetratricopeptide repeat protein [Pseudorhodoferax sp.]|nr:tetratricopeptide repeat protein [Pseudorhodoferax sp.]
MHKSKSALVFFLVLTLATAALYAPSLSNQLVFDDNRLTDGTVFDHYGSLLPLQPRMLAYGSFVWLQSLFGEGWLVQRVFNVVLHLGVAAGLYVLFQRLLQRTEFSEQARAEPGLEDSWRAALRVGVVLFALNPVAVYAVAYLIQRSILMATLFVVWACVAWVRGIAEHRPVFLLLALLSYVAAVLSKETVFMAAALAVPLYVFVARPPLRRVLSIAGVALLALGVVAAALYSRFGALVGVVFDPASLLLQQQLEQLAPGISEHIFGLSILNQMVLFFQYGFLWFVPNIQWMSIDLRPPFPLSYASFPHVLGGIGFIATLLASAWLVLRRSDLLGVLGLCLLCPLLLFVSEFATVWVQDPFVLYRSYFWAMAVPGLVALPLIGFKPKYIYPIGVVLGMLFGALALERVWSLRDEPSVWSDAVEKVERQTQASAVGRWRPYLNRGAYYLQEERAELAYADFARANVLGEPAGSAFFNMGATLQLLKKHEAALAQMAQALARGFDEPQLYFQRGESQYALGRFADAYASFDQSLRGAKPLPLPLQDVARLRRAESAIPVGQYDQAVTDLETLLAKKPGDQALLLRLGMAQVGRKDTQAALAIFDRMLAVRPSGGAHYGRAVAHMTAGDNAMALVELDRAIALEPNNAAYRNVRAQLVAPQTPK